MGTAKISKEAARLLGACQYGKIAMHRIDAATLQTHTAGSHRGRSLLRRWSHGAVVELMRAGYITAERVTDGIGIIGQTDAGARWFNNRGWALAMGY